MHSTSKRLFDKTFAMNSNTKRTRFRQDNQYDIAVYNTEGTKNKLKL